MITDTALAPILRDAAEGEIVVTGTLLPGLSGEQLHWVVMENVTTDEGEQRVTLHGYFYDIFVVSKVVFVHPERNQLQWGRTEVSR